MQSALSGYGIGKAKLYLPKNFIDIVSFCRIKRPAGDKNVKWK